MNSDRDSDDRYEASHRSVLQEGRCTVALHGQMEQVPFWAAIRISKAQHAFNSASTVITPRLERNLRQDALVAKECVLIRVQGPMKRRFM